jgi:hypothetical protein
MLLRYQSGEEVRAGDRIIYGGSPGLVEFVAELEDIDTAWYVEQFGGGCMLLTHSMGHVFIDKPENDEDLELVSRDVPPVK